MKRDKFVDTTKKLFTHKKVTIAILRQQVKDIEAERHDARMREQEVLDILDEPDNGETR